MCQQNHLNLFSYWSAVINCVHPLWIKCPHKPINEMDLIREAWKRPKPHEFYLERFWQKLDERSMVTKGSWTCICRAERIWWMIDCLWLPRSGMFSSKTVSHGKWAKVRQLVTGKRDQRESALVKRSPALGHRAACLETGFVIVFMVTINRHYCHWHIRHSERNWGKKSESYMIRFSFEDCWPNSGGWNSGTIDYLTSVNKLWVVANRIIGIWCRMMIINKKQLLTQLEWIHFYVM